MSKKVRILVVEDEPLIAIDLADFLDEFGWECVGPVNHLPAALEHAKTEPLDGAVLNLVIDGKHAYSVAEALADRGIPFGFASGLRLADLDARWQDRPYLDKPYDREDVRDFVIRILADGENHRSKPATQIDSPKTPSE